MAAINGFDSVPTPRFIVTRSLNSLVPIKIVAGYIYKSGEQNPEVVDLELVRWPKRQITLNVPYPCNDFMYQLFGYYSEDDKGPSARKRGPASELFYCTELVLDPCDPMSFESKE